MTSSMGVNIYETTYPWVDVSVAATTITINRGKFTIDNPPKVIFKSKSDKPKSGIKITYK